MPHVTMYKAHPPTLTHAVPRTLSCCSLASGVFHVVKCVAIRHAERPPGEAKWGNEPLLALRGTHMIVSTRTAQVVFKTPTQDKVVTRIAKHGAARMYHVDPHQQKK